MNIFVLNISPVEHRSMKKDWMKNTPKSKTCPKCKTIFTTIERSRKYCEDCSGKKNNYMPNR